MKICEAELEAKLGLKRQTRHHRYRRGHQAFIQGVSETNIIADDLAKAFPESVSNSRTQDGFQASGDGGRLAEMNQMLQNQQHHSEHHFVARTGQN